MGKRIFNNMMLPSKATRGLGQLVTKPIIGSPGKALKAVKADTKTLGLQNEYFDRIKE